MAAQGRLAKILEQEYKSRGFVAGTLTGGGKRLREILDLRNVLFSGGGIGSTIGKKIFGKGYSAVSDSGSVSRISSPITGFSKESVEILASIKSDTRTTAKNSMILPALARDMNVMRQNVVKLVKLSGGTAATKADAFFLRSKEREAAYESQFNRTTPTPAVQKPTESKSGGILAGLTGLITLMIPAISNAMKIGFSGLSSSLGVITKNINALVETIGVLSGNLLKALGLGAVSSVLGAGLKRYSLGKTPDVDVNKTTKPGSTKVKPSPTIPTPSTSTNQSSSQQQSGRGGRRGPKVSGRFGSVGSGGLAIQKSSSEEKGIQSKLKRIMSNEKLKTKFLGILSRRFAAGFAASLLSGPFATIVGVLFSIYTVYEISQIVDEVLSDSPINLKEQQSAMANLIYDRFREAGFSDAQARGAVANAVAESSLNPNAHNKQGEDSVGLFQVNRNGILGRGYSVEQLKDPETNIRVAIEAAKKSPMFNKATTMEEATEGFMKQVENPADQSSSAVQKRVNFGLAMQGSELGTRVNYASTDLANAQRNVGTGQSNVVLQQDNSVKNVQNQSSGPVSSTYNTDWDNLVSSVV